MNNSPMKGGSPDTFRIVKSSPGLLDFWQLHYSENVGKDVNSPNALSIGEMNAVFYPWPIRESWEKE